jgi:hypothetical protein
VVGGGSTPRAIVTFAPLLEEHKPRLFGFYGYGSTLPWGSVGVDTERMVVCPRPLRRS